MDDMFVATKEEIMRSCVNVLACQHDVKDLMPVIAVIDKLVGIWEGLVPTRGYVNKLADPTPADLAVLAAFEGIEQAGGSEFLGVFPRCKALVDRTKVAAGVSDWGATATQLKSAT
jgi:hypothetical protein